jgi:NTP pyrophosphatase (non-canonical NTP hydrolase)
MGDNMDYMSKCEFIDSFSLLQELAYLNSLNKGFHDNPVENGTRLALMHSEISEALEALRHGNPPSDKIPAFSGCEEELADCIIRIMDFAGVNRLKIAEAVIAKMEYNRGREHMHGGKEF